MAYCYLGLSPLTGLADLVVLARDALVFFVFAGFAFAVRVGAFLAAGAVMDDCLTARGAAFGFFLRARVLVLSRAPSKSI